MEPSQDPAQETLDPQTQDQDQNDAPTETKEGNMRAVFIDDFDKPPVVKEVPIPKPASGEVLIKVEAAPINPVDLQTLRGDTLPKDFLPARVGIEGSGVVISSGGGIIARTLVGKRVSFACVSGQFGSWSQYVVVQTQYVFPIDKNVNFELASCGVINPFTALGLLDVIKSEKHEAIVQEAAASQLGRMIVKLCKKEGIKTINVVRRAEQKKILTDLGADVVLDSSESGFYSELKKKTRELKATCLLECVCGDLTHKVIRAMPRDSACYIYGHLEKVELTKLDFNDILTHNKAIKPFIFGNWMSAQGMLSKMSITKKAQNLLLTDFKPEISKAFNVEEIKLALQYYKENMTAGKVIIHPWQ